MILPHRSLIAVCSISLLASGVVARADLHQFQSADGEKSFYAELLRFDDSKKVVTVRKVSGKEVHFPLAALSEKDQKWVDVQKEILAAGRNLKIDLKGKWGERSTKAGSASKTITTQRLYNLELSNYGSVALSDLEVTCDVHLFRDDGKGGSRSVQSNTEKISYLSSGLDRDIKMKPISLSLTVPLSTVIGSSSSGGGGG